VRGRKLQVAIEGLTDIEIATLAGQLDKKISLLEARTHIVDSSKLALYAALDYAAQLYSFKQKFVDEDTAAKNRLDSMIKKVENAINDEDLF